MKINGKEFKVDISMDGCIRMRNKVEELTKSINDLNDVAVTGREKLKVSHSLICNFFDDVLGSGESEKILGADADIKKSYSTLNKFINKLDKIISKKQKKGCERKWA